MRWADKSAGGLLQAGVSEGQAVYLRFARAKAMVAISILLLPGAALAATTVPPAPGDAAALADITVDPGASLTFTRNTLTVAGGITLGAGATLTLVSTLLYMESDLASISLGAGARLELMANSSLRDNRTDVDDGSLSDLAYYIDLAAGATLRVVDSAVEGSYGVTGLDARVEFERAGYRLNRGGFVLDGSSEFASTNATFTSNPSPLLDLRGASAAAVRGGLQPSYALAPSASFSFSTFAAVEVRDAQGKPLGGADFAFESLGGLLAASRALGGALPGTLLNHEGFPVPLFVEVPHLVDTGGSKTYPGAAARVKYAEWADARVLNTSADQVVPFVSLNRGVALQDVSMAAMLDVMPMHGDMGDMGGMDMMGPMMTQGPGSAWGDFNGDGNVDAIVTAAPETDEMMLMEMMMNVTDYPEPQLFLGTGTGGFSHAADTGLSAAKGASGISAADFDGDGDLDLFVARYGHGGMAMEDLAGRIDFMDGVALNSMLFRNDGTGRFTDVTAASGFDMPARYTVGGVWGDYNRDGCLDLYVVNMGQMVMLMMEGAPADEMMHMSMDMNYIRPQANYLYRSNCDGTFSDVTAAAGAPTGGLAPGSLGEWQGLVQDPVTQYWYANLSRTSPAGSGLSYTAAFFDFDEDGWPDLLVADDFGVSPVYRNNGDGTFTLRTVEAGLNKVGSAMGFAMADFDRDGHLDIFQSNFNEDYLWINNGDGTFTDRAFEYGVADMGVGWGVAAPDLNNDGYPDLAISTGYMSMMMKASERSVVYLNDRGSRFWDATAASPFDDDPALGISVATADVDRDGRLDLFLGKITGMNGLFLNREGSGGSVRLDLRGMVSNSFGIGAEVTALVGGKPFRAAVQPGGEYASSSEPGVWIGLGGAAAAQRVTVYWPSGVVQPLGDLASGARLTVREDVGAVADAGPDGSTNTSVTVALSGEVVGAELRDASYAWVFHGPTGTTTLEGQAVSFAPTAPGVYAAEFIVTDRFGETYGSDFCIMRVADTSAPDVVIEVPKAITASGRATFNASATTDNDPAFAGAALYDWTFKNGGLEVKATGVKPTVQLPKPGMWNVTLKVTDPSGNVRSLSVEAKVTGFAPSTVTQDMVLLAMGLTLASIVGLAALSTRIWRREDADDEPLVPEHFGELKPHDIVVAAEARDSPPFPFRPDTEEE